MTAARGRSVYRCAVRASSPAMSGASITHTVSSADSSSDITAWPWLANMSARPSRTLGSEAWTLTRVTLAWSFTLAGRFWLRVLLARADADGQFLDFATSDEG